jgi:hypothetical protein
LEHITLHGNRFNEEENMSAQVHSLYSRLGGDDAITAAVENLLDERCAAGGGSRKTAAPMGCAVKNSC